LEKKDEQVVAQCLMALTKEPGENLADCHYNDMPIKMEMPRWSAAHVPDFGVIRLEFLTKHGQVSALSSVELCPSLRCASLRRPDNALSIFSEPRMVFQTQASPFLRLDLARRLLLPGSGRWKGIPAQVSSTFNAFTCFAQRCRVRAHHDMHGNLCRTW
jgi:hypothetical protein